MDRYTLMLFAAIALLAIAGLVINTNANEAQPERENGGLETAPECPILSALMALAAPGIAYMRIKQTNKAK